MVHAAIQKAAVMGYKNKSLFAVQIPADDFPSPDIQVVGRLVDEQKVIFLGKQHRQLQFGLLPSGECIIRAVKQFLRKLQSLHLPGDFPVFVIGINPFHHVDGRLTFIRHGIWEIRKLHRSGNRPPVVIVSLQEI